MSEKRCDTTTAELSFSVVIPAFTVERWALIERAVESARGQTKRPETVILSVDNNDELLGRARDRWGGALGPPVQVVANQYRDHLT